MWWRLELLLKGLAKRLMRGGVSDIAAPEIVLLHQAILRLERRIEVLEKKIGFGGIVGTQGNSDVN
jgi:hypothetical protein